jgi:hypothetical protein
MRRLSQCSATLQIWCAKGFDVTVLQLTLILLQGHLHALFNVAMMHLNGFGTQRNCPLAATYLRVSAVVTCCPCCSRFANTYAKFVVERGPVGQMMHRGYNRWMAGEQLALVVA